MRAPLICIILALFLVNCLGPMPAYSNEVVLPKPGVMVALSPAFNPSVLRGIKVYPDNPLKFEFVLNQGDANFSNEELREESQKLVKYFLASMTVPEKDLWVNLSPYEKNRIIPESFGQTEMGRDLLAQDYVLKQITSTLMYPEESLGKEFWKRIFAKAPPNVNQVTTNMFNKIWIVPDKALVYENTQQGVAYIVKSRLKVMLESDYVAESKNGEMHLNFNNSLSNQQDNEVNKIIKSVILPELEREVNEGKNFAVLRQVYHSLILAQWYKKKIKQSILAKVYVDQNKVGGTEYGRSLKENGLQNTSDTDFIYQQYLQAFKKGVYSYIKEERDLLTNQVIARKYFAGGMKIGAFKVGDFAMTTDASVVQEDERNVVVDVDLAMTAQEKLIGQLADSPEKMILDPDFALHILATLGDTQEQKGYIKFRDIVLNGKLIPVSVGVQNTVVRIGPLVFVTNGKLREYQFQMLPLIYVKFLEQVKKVMGIFYQRRKHNIFFTPPTSVTQLASSNIAAKDAIFDAHTMLTIASILEYAEKFKGATVVDIGAGYGTLSQIALKLGAKKVYAFEIDPTISELARQGLSSVEADKSKYYVGIKDVSQRGSVREIVDLVGKDADKVIVLSNTGVTYGLLNERSLEIASQFNNLEFVINAGHYAGSREVLGEQAFLDNQQVITRANRSLNGLGLNVETITFYPNGDNNEGIQLLVAQRDKAMSINMEDYFSKRLNFDSRTQSLLLNGKSIKEVGRGGRNIIFDGYEDMAFRVYQTPGEVSPNARNGFETMALYDLGPKVLGEGFTNADNVNGYYYLIVEHIEGLSLDKMESLTVDQLRLLKELFVKLIGEKYFMSDVKPQQFMWGKRKGDQFERWWVIDAEMVEKVEGISDQDLAKKYLSVLIENDAYNYDDWSNQALKDEVFNFLKIIIEGRFDMKGINDTGGIDLTSDKDLAIENDGSGEFIFNSLDPAMQVAIQEAKGFEPIINRIEPLNSIRVFLGILPSQN